MTTKNYLEIKTENFIFRLEKFNDSIFRIRRAVNLNSFNENSLAVLQDITPNDIKYKENNNNYVIETDSLDVNVNCKTSSVIFLDKNNRVILKEHKTKIVKNSIDYSIKQTFNFDSDEGLYGLGQYQDGNVNHMNHKVVISQSNRTIAVPFLTSSKGYGILWDNNSWTEFETENATGGFYSEIADSLDYYFVYGTRIDEAVAGYRFLTGQAPMFGKWAYGYWQCKERYKSFDELESIIKEYRDRKIPIDNLVQDWQYWGELGWSALDFDLNKYPEPEKRIAELHEKYNCKLMVSIWPSLGAESEVCKELKSKNMVYPVKCWNEGFVYDVYNPEAQDIYWKYVKNNLYKRGVDAYWIDGSEPEFFAAHTRDEFKKQMYEAGECYLGSLKKYFNPYALKAVQPIYEGQRKATDKKRVYILTRSGFSGLQRFAASSWSGDVAGSWEVLKKHIAAGINFCMAGIPYWTHDIGGFFTNRYKAGCNDPEYRELYLRWFQFGAFSPIFRSHGTNTPREIWRFGEKGEPIYEALVNFAKLRYRLMPYIYSCAGMITQKGYTIMRGLAMDFPEDKKCLNINDQYMFGASILVAPVTERMYFKSDFEDGDVVDSKYFVSDEGIENCLTGEYFEGFNFQELKLKKNDSCIDFDWSGGTPEGVSYYNYSIRWKGFIFSDTDGLHELTLVSCAAKIKIDGKVFIDKLHMNDSELRSYKFSFKFEAGKKYPVEIEYKRVPNSASICLKWVKPGQNTVTVPKTEKVRNLYLPENENWYDFWNHKKYSGGKFIKRETPLEIMPLFVREGAILPFGPEIQYTSEKPSDPVEIYIYTGKDGFFTLYEDEGDNYNYEKGFFSTIDLQWNDSEKVLTVEERKGCFDGMLNKKTFIPVIIKDGKKIIKDSVEYCGKLISIDC